MMSDSREVWADPTVAEFLAETGNVPIGVSVRELRRSRQFISRLARLLRDEGSDAAGAVAALAEWVERQEDALRRPLHDPDLLAARRARDEAAEAAEAATRQIAKLRAQLEETEAWEHINRAAADEQRSRAEKAERRAAGLDAALLDVLML